VVVVAALAGAAYLDRAGAAADAPTVLLGDGQHVVGLDLQSFLDRGNDPHTMLAQAYERVEHVYYKPVPDQALVRGEETALTKFLELHKVADPRVPQAVATGDRAHDLSVLENTLSTVTKRYGNVATPTIYTQVALTGMLGGLGDPYTTYLSPQEIGQLDEQLDGGNFAGIGVYIVQDQKTGAIVVDPIEGNPAIKAGVRTGDTILAVDGHSTMGQKIDAVEREIRGPSGTVVNLTLRRHTSRKTDVVPVTRAQVHVPSVRAEIEDHIDYIRLADFGQTSADEVRKALLDGKAQNVRGYILDLRNNGGGLLDAGVDVSSLFIPQGPIVSTIDRAGDREVRDATGHAVDAKPLVVLVNQYTASASEITAGAIQDYGVGTLVGTKTFGKGVVQSLYTMPDKGALKITTARYLTPKGRDIQHKGIIPDVVVPQRVDQPIIDTPADAQLNAAKKIIEKKDA